MGNFNRDRDGGNRGGGGGGSRFGGGDRNSRGGGGGFSRPSWGGGRPNDREVVMHQAICAECKKSCEVPFRPTNDRPVYCKDCFAAKGGPSIESRAPRGLPTPTRQAGDFASRNFAKPRFEGNRGLPAPTRQAGGDQGGSDVKRQLEMINTKLDKLISIMGAGASKKPTQDFTVKKEGLKEAVSEAVKNEAKSVPAKVKKASSKKISKKK